VHIYLALKMIENYGNQGLEKKQHTHLAVRCQMSMLFYDLSLLRSHIQYMIVNVQSIEKYRKTGSVQK